MNKVSGINEIAVDRMIDDIALYADRIKRIFNDIETVVTQTQIFYVCDSATTFRNNFNQLAYNFKSINQSVLSYANDFANLKANIKSRMEEAKTIIDKANLNIGGK